MDRRALRPAAFDHESARHFSGQAGVLGQPTTTILLGDETLGEGSRNGGRMDFGYWLDPCETVGFQVGYIGIGSATADYTAESNGTPILARPFFNTQTGQNDSHLIAYPGVVQGTFTAAWSNEFQDLEVLFRRAINRSWFGRVDLVAGYRFARLDDGLQINEDVLTDTAPGSVSATAIDSFRTRNEFNGGELGLVADDGPLPLVAGGDGEAGRWATPTIWSTSTVRRSLEQLLTPAGCWRCRQTSAHTEATSSPSFPNWGSTSATI